MKDIAAGVQNRVVVARLQFERLVDILQGLVEFHFRKRLSVGQTVESVRPRWRSTPLAQVVDLFPVFDGTPKLPGVLKELRMRSEPLLSIASHREHSVAIG